MFVYLLRYATEPRFKIGKAIDIYQRILGIGGLGTFDIANSLCVQLPNEDAAYRLEKILHRLFEPWNLPVNESKRYSGDTEHFAAECFGRVIKFLVDNVDLTAGALPSPLPTQTVLIATENAIALQEERRLIRAAKELRIEERQKVRTANKLLEDAAYEQMYLRGIEILKSSITQLSEMQLDVFGVVTHNCVQWDGVSRPEQFIVIESCGVDSFNKVEQISEDMWGARADPRGRRHHCGPLTSSTSTSPAVDNTDAWRNEKWTMNLFLKTALIDSNKGEFRQEYVDFFESIPKLENSIESLDLSTEDWIKEWERACESTPQNRRKQHAK